MAWRISTGANNTGAQMGQIELSNTDKDAEFIRQKLNQYNFALVPLDDHEKLCLVVREGHGVVAGLVGGTYWKWLYVQLLWVDEGWRGRGLGSSLLARAEAIAIERGCQNAHLETHDFQNPGFYEHRGYRVFGQLADLPEGHTKFFLHKRLANHKPE
jgi:GNAT superfamily N-acetyltransferase